MRVALAADVLAQSSQHGHALNAIIDLCRAGRHHWIIDDLDAVLDSEWVSGAARWDSINELAEKTFRAAVDEFPASLPFGLVVVTTSAPAGALPRGTWHLEPARARAVLGEAAYVVLENATSDWCFVLALVKAYERPALEAAISEDWLRPDQAGGSGELLKRARALVDRGVVPWRIAVLMDSDRLVPGPLPPGAVKRAADLQALDVTTIVLDKREVENYLPAVVLDSAAVHATYVSWLSLSRVQRDYFDMKYGFSADPTTGDAIVPAGQSTLFGGHNPWHLKRLVRGFGQKVGDRFGMVQITRADLDEVCATCPGELERLLRSLEELL